MTAYYNEFDPFAANWLRELIKDGLIAPGVVDERSITEVLPDDLSEFTQCHFFAGIGGWSIALRLAGWPDDRPVWTGSPPCQPFSTAGNQKGTDDERHLWPAFFDLIRKQAPTTVFGEQVASAIRHGWFDSLQKDMENQGYASAMAVLPACIVGAPQKRDRLWYVANKLANTDDDRQPTSDGGRKSSKQPEAGNDLGWSGQTNAMADAQYNGYNKQESNPTEQSRDKQNVGVFDRRNFASARESTGVNDSNSSNVANPSSKRLQRSEWGGSSSQERAPGRHDAKCSEFGSLANSNDGRQPRSREFRRPGDTETSGNREIDRVIDASSFGNFWQGSDFLYCRDGKARQIPTEPTLFPLADGVSNRVGILRGAGNAIVPQVAAEVIKAFMEFEVNK